MICVTIGVGADYRPLAEEAAARCRDATGRTTYIFSDLPAGIECPHHLKFELFELFPAERILYFDADLWMTGDWQPLLEATDPSLLYAVKDKVSEQVAAELRHNEMKPDDYFNSGLMLLSRAHHKKFLARAKKLRRDKPNLSNFWDQTHLNLARLQLGIRLQWLDSDLNYHGEKPRSIWRHGPPRGAHFHPFAFKTG